MPSRRAYLAMLAATAGCTSPFSSGSPADGDDAPTDSPTDTSLTDAGATVTYEYVGTDDLPTGERALVLPGQWRDWLRTAASGDTARGRIRPEDCGRSPVQPGWTVRLRHAGDLSGSYAVEGDTGGHYIVQYRAAQATPPEDTTVHRFADLPAAVRDPVGRILDGMAVDLPPQNRPYQYIRREGRQGDGSYPELWVRRDGTTYRVHPDVPTITPPCDYYVALRFSSVDGADRTLSLATVNQPDTIAADARAEAERPLTDYTGHDRSRLREFDHVMTLAGFYRVRVTTD
jgi:hypothetical protein